ncbi:PTS IIA-like nitrogen regulatory protein PtsN [Endothiovibrio diazotrophicus]
MQLSELLCRECSTRTLQAGSKKRALELVSEMIANHLDALTQAEIFDSLIGRERLGSTGMGHGVAIPHGRVKGIARAIGAFVRLEQAVDFDAIDRQPVDLLFFLLVPEHYTDEHLQILSTLAEMFSDEPFCATLRAAADDASLYRLIVDWQPASSALQ